MIRNIIFDMGNVLLDYNPDAAMELLHIRSEARAIIKQELFLGEEWKQGDLGYITNAERYDGVSKRVPEEYHKELRQVVDHWDVCMVPLPWAKEYVKYKKDEGYHLYILSNACAEFYHYFPRHYDMDLFDGIVVSSDLHIVKPDTRIYTYLLDTYHIRAEESLFIDDVKANVEAAVRLGIHGCVFCNSFQDVDDCIKNYNA